MKFVFECISGREDPINPVGGARRRTARKSGQFEIEETLGATLQQLRQSRGLNQTELGRQLGVSLQQVQKYESGRDRMAASTLIRAAEILGVEAGALYAGLSKSRSQRARSSKKDTSPVLVVPLTVGPRAVPARETELIELIRSYQAIESVALRASVRQIVRRLSANARRAMGKSA